MILLVALTVFGATVAYDVHTNGKGVFAKSKAGELLDSWGALPFVENAWTKSMSTSARGIKLAEKHLPVYYNQTTTVLKPYFDFTKDFAWVVWTQLKRGSANAVDVVAAKVPVVSNFVSYLFLKKIHISQNLIIFLF